MQTLQKVTTRDNSIHYFDPAEIVHVSAAGSARQRGSSVCMKNGYVVEVALDVEELMDQLFKAQESLTP